MTHLETQKGKDGMKGSEHFKELGATASCSLRASLAVTRRTGTTRPEELIIGDSWFGSVKAAVAQGKAGFECIFQVKTNHSLFPKKHIEDLLKGAPGGVSVVLQSEVEGIHLLAIGYKYNTKSTLFFVCTGGAGSTAPGQPYEMKWSDDHGNIHVRNVQRPAVLSKFFKYINGVDIHNHLRQSCLKLEKKWITMDCWFRLTTTLLGMSVVDTFRLCQFHGFIPRGRMHTLVMDDVDDEGTNELTMKKFGGILATQLIYKAYNLEVEDLNMFDEDGMNPPGNSSMRGENRRAGQGHDGRSSGRSGRNGSSRGSGDNSGGNRSKHTIIPTFISERRNASSRYCVGDVADGYGGSVFRGSHDVSSVSLSNLRSAASDTITTINDDMNHDFDSVDGSDCEEGFNFTYGSISRTRKHAIAVLTDASMRKHSVVKLKCTTSNGKSTKGKRYVKPRKCVSCGSLSRVKCLECDEVYCFPVKKQYKVSNSCFCKHINAVSSPIERMIKRKRTNVTTP